MKKVFISSWEFPSTIDDGQTVVLSKLFCNKRSAVRWASHGGDFAGEIYSLPAELRNRFTEENGFITAWPRGWNSIAVRVKWELKA